MKSSIFEIVKTTTGATSIRNTVVNEIMHNPVGPWAEANALYVDQPQLKKRLAEPTASGLVIFDIGLGAASNALAALTCAHQLGEISRPLHIISFERDMDLLQFALDHADLFPHFENYKSATQDILSQGHWTDGKHRWDLRQGEFADTIVSEMTKPHIIFFDPYSPAVNEEMWTLACFQSLKSKIRSKEEGGTELYTYSLATRIRTALLLSGFHVGHGNSTGLKKETTQAASEREALHTPLTPAWFARWQRSHARYPTDANEEMQKEIDIFIRQYISENGIVVP